MEQRQPQTDKPPSKTTQRTQPARPDWVKVIGVTLVVLACVVSGVISYLTRGQDQRPLSPPAPQQIARIGLYSPGTAFFTLDPALTTDTNSFEVEQLLFPPLVTVDSNLNVIPWAAQSLPSITNNGLTYTFMLHKGFEWSDGTPITAATYAYALNRALDPCVNNGKPADAATVLNAIAGAEAFHTGACDAPPNALNPTDTHTLIGSSIKALDASTLQITLGAPSVAFLATLTTAPALPIPQQLIAKYGFANWTHHLTGFGGNLFDLRLWDGHSVLSLSHDIDFPFGPTSIFELDFTLYQSGAAELADYDAGMLNLLALPSAFLPIVKARASVSIAPRLALDELLPNWRIAPFDNIVARQAFALATNKTALATMLEHGEVFASNHLVPEGSPGYSPNLNGVDGSYALVSNPALAQKDIAAYARQTCGGVVAQCPLVTLTYSNARQEPLAQALLAQWRASLPGYPLAVALTTSSAPSTDRPQLMLASDGYSYPDQQSWLSQRFLPGAADNLNGVSDLAATALLHAADAKAQGIERYMLYGQAEQRLVTDVAQITLDQQLLVALVGNDSAGLRDFRFSPGGFVTLPTWLNAYIAPK